MGAAHPPGIVSCGRLLAALLTLGAAASRGGAQQAGDGVLRLSAGEVTVEVQPWPRGVSVSLAGVPVSLDSGLVVTTPPWAPHHYQGPSPESIASATVTESGLGVRATLEHHGAHGAFDATDTLTLNDDGTFRRETELRYRGQDPEALVQWRIAALSPAPIIGRPWRAELADGRTVGGRVPIEPLDADPTAAALARGFRWIEFDSRIGTLRIESDSDAPLICYDYRRSRWADPASPRFWLGDMGARLERDRPARYAVTFHLSATPAATAATATTATAAVQHRPDAQRWPDAPTLVPRPKRVELDPGAFPLPAVLPPFPALPDDARAAARALASGWKDRFDLPSADNSAAPDGPDLPVAAIQFRSLPPDDLPPQGYRLRVTPEAIEIAAPDSAGFHHAVQTILQLTHRGAADNDDPSRPAVRACRIADWPTLAFRGVHLVPGGQGPALHTRLIRDILAAGRFNHLVLEAEYIEWESAPEIHHPDYGMPKDEVRQILELCRGLGIQVSPLVNSPGHAQWIFTGGNNLDLAEDPEAKWAYCITNPRTYEFLFRIYEETLALFEPEWVHIGHDEFADRGRLPYRASSKPYTVEQLFMMDTLRLHGWLAARGVKVMMWGDMLLAPGEAPDATHARTPASAAALRAELPDDVLIADWHYGGDPPDSYDSLRIFQDAGHPVVAATWSRPLNIVNFARAAHDQHALGLLQTTWAGYSLDPHSFARELPQYAAWILAADAAWNADDPPDPARFPFGQVFLDRMGMSDLAPARSAGWTLDLAAVASYPLAAADDDGWFGLGPRHDLRSVSAGDIRLTGLAFHLAEHPSGGPAALVLPGRLGQTLPLPRSATIMLAQPQTARRLAFLHTTEFASADDARVADYRIIFADGATEHLPVRYGHNIVACSDTTRLAPHAPIVWSGETPAGTPRTLRCLLWDNPRPDVPIAAIAATAGDASGSLILLAVTGLAEPQP